MCLRMRRPPYSSRRRGCCSSRCRTAVVPTTSVQSATASATLSYSSALASSSAAPTADRAVRKAFSYGFTTRSREKPKLLMARAAAPILRGLRDDTSTTRRRSSLREAGKTAHSNVGASVSLVPASPENAWGGYPHPPSRAQLDQVFGTKNSGASLRRTAGGGCPHVVRRSTIPCARIQTREST